MLHDENPSSPLRNFSIEEFCSERNYLQDKLNKLVKQFDVGSEKLEFVEGIIIYANGSMSCTQSEITTDEKKTHLFKQLSRFISPAFRHLHQLENTLN